MGKKYDHMSMIDESGRTIVSESGSVKLENPLGFERKEIATTTGDHASSYERKVPIISGNIIFDNGRKLSDMDFTDRRITLRDTVTGNRIICHKCQTQKLGALGKDNPEFSILVLGQIQEL